jgi:hypothetical protein
MIRDARPPDRPQAEDAEFPRHAGGAEGADRTDDRDHAPTSRSSSDEELADVVCEPDLDLLDKD